MEKKIIKARNQQRLYRSEANESLNQNPSSNKMAAPPNVELEAAKFLHKLIQESTDEPTKLARKLYVILQHMRSNGKENSMPYQVISRAMETVINQHSIDMEALNSSHLPLSGGTHMGDSSSTQFAGSSQTAAIAKDSKAGMSESEVANSHPSSRPPVGPSSAGHDIYQGSVSRLGTKSLDDESPSSFDTRSANSQSQERHDTSNRDKANQNDGKMASSKRKRADSSSTAEPHIDNPQHVDTGNLHARKGKLVNKVKPPGSLSVKGSKHSHFNLVQGSGQMEHIPTLPSSMSSTNITNSISQAANSEFPEEIEVSSSALGLQHGGSRLSTLDILSSRGLWNHNMTEFPLEKSQVSRFPSNAGSSNSTAEILMHQSNAPVGSSASGKVHGAAPGSSGSYPPVEQGIMSPMHFSSASYDNLGLVVNASKERIKEPCSALPSVEHDGGTSNVLANANKMVQSGIPGNIMEMNMLRSAASSDTGKSSTSLAPGVSNMPFKEQHLKQLRAQCLIFLAFRNGLMPKKLHLEIALGNFLQKEDAPQKGLIDHKGKELSIKDPNNIPQDTMPLGRPNNVRKTERVARPSSTGLLPKANFSREAACIICIFILSYVFIFYLI
ncbi:unnamed protein product [Camellia sinensis]